jgi:hypothetical protein
MWPKPKEKLKTKKLLLKVIVSSCFDYDNKL